MQFGDSLGSGRALRPKSITWRSTGTTEASTAVSPTETFTTCKSGMREHSVPIDSHQSSLPRLIDRSSVSAEGLNVTAPGQEFCRARSLR